MKSPTILICEKNISDSTSIYDKQQRSVFFSFKSIKTERVIIITVLFRGCFFSLRNGLLET